MGIGEEAAGITGGATAGAAGGEFGAMTGLGALGPALALAAPALVAAIMMNQTSKEKAGRLGEERRGFLEIAQQMQGMQSPEALAALLQGYQGQTYPEFGTPKNTLALGALVSGLFPGENLAGALRPWEGSESRAWEAAGLPYGMLPGGGYGYDYDREALYARLIKELGGGTPLTAQNYATWMKAAAPTTPPYADWFAYQAANPWEPR